MGAEHSQQRGDGREVFEGQRKSDTAATVRARTIDNSTNKRQQHQPNNGGVANFTNKQSSETASPTASEISRPSSPPLSVCSDLPYVSYTDKPIGGDSPKIQMRGRSGSALHSSSSRKSHPTGAKPKRPQSTVSSHSIVIVKPGGRDSDFDIDPDLARLRNIPQFLPVLRESISSATVTRDPEVLGRLHSEHLMNICCRMQTHLNVCAVQIATDQNHLVERTKIVSNSITTLFASFVDMQKTYSSYAEQFTKIRSVSQQLARCNSLLNENIASIEAINNFLDIEDRLEPFVWRTDDNKLRSEAESNRRLKNF
ncbi:BLOC-1-related complex subunit 5 [Teleopsis dalmanni]|uniref:BLOC-1-related complex subunit 5 n=1 Tax=Teleopsis dalmanni TaxID=139649 RepID=UPI0018CE1107|nr:BLOC-1-related complex subunit 5 [Teleopsis dalmanni]